MMYEYTGCGVRTNCVPAVVTAVTAVVTAPRLIPGLPSPAAALGNPGVPQLYRNGGQD